MDPNPHSDPSCLHESWWAEQFERDSSPDLGPGLLIVKIKPIYASIPSFWRGDDGNPNFRAGFKSNAKQYGWSSVDVVFLSTESVFFCRHSLSASITEKRTEDNEEEECFLCYFSRRIGNVLSAVSSVFSLLLNMLSYLEGECGSPLLSAMWTLDVE